MTFGLDTVDRTPGLRLKDLPAGSRIAIRKRSQLKMQRAEAQRVREALRDLAPAAGTVGLTKQQARLLAFLRCYIDDNGVSPTYSEMCLALGVSSRRTVFELVNRLDERGYITRSPVKARSIALVMQAHASCPNCGHTLSGAAQ